MNINVLIKNQNSKILNELQIDVIKTLEGEFNKSDIEKEFINLFYNKVVIDITAIRNYYDFASLFDFLSFFDPNKVIILLNDSELVNSTNYLSKLVERGFYNFTKNASSIGYLIDHPNNIEDVKKYIQTNSMSITANESGKKQEDMPNSFGVKSLFSKKNIFPEEKTSYAKEKKEEGKMIIGIQNITEHAGATTLMYMLVKQLSYHYKVKGIEMNNQDAVHFRDDRFVTSTSLEDLKMKINLLKDVNVIVVDLNGLDASHICNEILYLIEPGTIRLNKLFKSNSGVLDRVKNGKVVLNRSAVKDGDVNNLEYETKLKVFYNMPNFDERKERIQVVDELIGKLRLKKTTDR